MALGYLIPYDPHGIMFKDVETSAIYGTVTGVSPTSHGYYQNTIDLGIFSIAPLAPAIPAQKRNTLQIPGKNGLIDLSTVLTKVPVYENRTGSWDFIVDNCYPTDTRNWANKYEKIVNALHGKTVYVYLLDDPNWFYKGNVQVGEWKATHPWASINISYDLEPYKYSKKISTVLFECTSGSSSYTVTASCGGTTYVNAETRSNSTPFDLNNVTNVGSNQISMLDFMPVIPTTKLWRNGGDDSFDITCTLKNTKLGYQRKAMNLTGTNSSESNAMKDPYGFQSFVMTDIGGECSVTLGQNSSGTVITTNKGKLELSWRNGRL